MIASVIRRCIDTALIWWALTAYKDGMYLSCAIAVALVIRLWPGERAREVETGVESVVIHTIRILAGGHKEEK